jgi:hypothetical protein
VAVATLPGAGGFAASGRLNGAPSPRSTERLPQPVRRQRPGLAALGIMLVVGCSAVSASLLVASDEATSVLTVVRPVPAGRVVTSGDLGTADIAGRGLTAVGADSRDAVVGLTAAVDLLPGTLLSDAMVTREPVPGPGQAVVGLSLKPGLLPEAEVRAGTTVMLLRLPAPPGAEAGASGPRFDDVLVQQARVLSETSDPTTGGRLVSLLVEAPAAAEVARAAAAGTVSLVVIGPGS